MLKHVVTITLEIDENNCLHPTVQTQLPKQTVIEILREFLDANEEIDKQIAEKQAKENAA